MEMPALVYARASSNRLGMTPEQGPHCIMETKQLLSRRAGSILKPPRTQRIGNQAKEDRIAELRSATRNSSRSVVVRFLSLAFFARLAVPCSQDEFLGASTLGRL